MKKIKLFVVAIVTAFCCVALSACELMWTGFYITAGIAYLGIGGVATIYH